MYDAIKRSLDVVGAGMGLLLSAPVIAASAAAVRLTMGSPVFFLQERPGLHGDPFTLVKLRTMRHPDPGVQESDADRMTGVGKFVRSYSLDELPTLWNVLRGDMSLVGPRPLLMRYLPRYSERQSRRHEAKPGVTGWAQINGRNAIGWEQKLELDVWYVENRSLLLDLQILVRTVTKVLRREGISHPDEATMTEFMGINHDPRKPEHDTPDAEKS